MQCPGNMEERASRPVQYDMSIEAEWWKNGKQLHIQILRTNERRGAQHPPKYTLAFAHEKATCVVKCWFRKCRFVEMRERSTQASGRPGAGNLPDGPRFPAIAWPDQPVHHWRKLSPLLYHFARLGLQHLESDSP
jgi:hypothetical protein